MEMSMYVMSVPSKMGEFSVVTCDLACVPSE